MAHIYRGTKVSRRGSLVGGQIVDRPELHVQIPSSSGSSRTSSGYSIMSPAAFPAIPESTPHITPRIQTRVYNFARKYVTYLYFFVLFWILLIHHFERSYPRSVVRTCEWPLESDSSTQIMLTADPQLIDQHTYPNRPRVLMKMSELISDLYLRRNWFNSNRILDPDMHFFLGDLLDAGREWPIQSSANSDWIREFRRWNRIFTKPAHKKTILGVPGNHDIGFGNTVDYNASLRFAMFFGEPNSVHTIGKHHQLVLVDSLSLMNNKNSSVYAPPITFLKDVKDNIESGTENYTRILLTHVPLYRNPNHECGAFRESKRPIPWEYGYQYQTMLSPEVSQYLLDHVQPNAIFTGDDHDACLYNHKFHISSSEEGTEEETISRIHTAPEYTVKSASMAMGIRRPAVQLLSLSDTTGQYSTRLCYMPDPFIGFINYGVFAVLTLIFLLAINFKPEWFPWWMNDFLTVQKKRSEQSRSRATSLSTMSPAMGAGSQSPLPPLATMLHEKMMEDRYFMKQRLGRGKYYKIVTIGKDVIVLLVVSFCYFTYLTVSIYKD